MEFDPYGLSDFIIENKEENTSYLIAGNFEKDMRVKDWSDPYDSIWLKMISVVVYTIEVMASIVMFMFVRYETQGLAGHYRTIINQFLSYLYGVVSLPFLMKFKDFSKQLLLSM